MSLKVIIPTGRTEITVNGLHQWDYGRTIEIHANGLPAMVEVHFACAGMSEAVVRSCAVVDGAVTAAVPDMCLEQTTPIVAWVYAVGEMAGATVLTITLPVTPRTRPQPSETVPEEVADKYTEAVAAMNDLVAEYEQTTAEVKAGIKTELEQELSSGTLVVPKASRAEEADFAGYAASAGNATTAEKDDTTGRPLSSALCSVVSGYSLYSRGTDSEETSIAGGVVAFRLQNQVATANDIRLIAEVGDLVCSTCQSAIFYDTITGGKLTGEFPMRLEFTHDGSGRYHVRPWACIDGTWVEMDSSVYVVSIYYKHLVSYPVG